MRYNYSKNLFENVVDLFGHITHSKEDIINNKASYDVEKVQTEQEITEMDIANIMAEQTITDLDLRLMVLEG